MIHRPLIRSLTRRQALAAGIAAGIAAPARAGSAALPQVRLKALEASTRGGRLGVAIHDTGVGSTIGYRMDERFALCSTFKMPLAAAVLEAADRGELSLDEKLTFGKSDIVAHAPVTGPKLGDGAMAIRDLAEAAQKTSDNVAANLLVKRLGGPSQVTGIWRRWGDPMTRLDRYEPQMNLVRRDDLFDTTTPDAMVQLAGRLVAGSILKAASRDLLMQWMADTTTGAKRLRAGLPQGWRAGDKTGTSVGVKGLGNKYNDVAVVWRPGKAAVAVAAYFESPYEGNDIRAEDQAVLAEVGRIAAAWIALIP